MSAWILLLGVACRSSPTPDVPVDTDLPTDTDVLSDTDVLVDTDVPADTDPPVDTDVPDVEPPIPAGLTRWMTGDPADADVVPGGPGLILMGGGSEPDAAFTWWVPLLAGGDVVVLRASGSDGYNSYLYADIGGVDSVETLRVDTRALADDPYVAWRVAHAEGVFLAGGDQAVYVDAWDGTALEDAVHTAWSRGAVVGGTSAGLAVLGDRVFTAEQGTVYSWEALEDPYNPYMTFDDDVFALPPLVGWITDSHFAERDRMGRLVGFLARMHADGLPGPARGLGVDEGTALVVGPDGTGTVVGVGQVYVLEAAAPADVCVAGAPLGIDGVRRVRLSAGGTVTLPDPVVSPGVMELSASGGALSPADPYAP